MTKKPFYVPTVFIHGIAEETRLVENYTGDESKEYVLSPVQKVFVLFEHPESCHLGTIIAILTGSVIVLNTVLFIVSTSPEFQASPPRCDYPACNNDPVLCPGHMICKPIALYTFQYVEAACVVCFTVQYLVRMLTCWSVSPRLAGITTDSKSEMPATWKFFRYFIKLTNVIDLLAIVPLYALLAKYGEIVIDQNSGFIRILWLHLLLSSFKGITGPSAVSEIFFKTMHRSAQALLFTFFFISIGTVVFASIVFILESGKFQVTAAYPNGAYLRDNDILGVNGDLSLFTSIPLCMYFTVVTTTSLGYGDMVPRTPGGLCVACVLCILGVGVLALPIAVIGGNFADLYAAYISQVEDRTSRNYSDFKNNKSLDAASVSSVHEKQCKILAKTADDVAVAASLQADAFTRASELLNVIVERSRRAELARVMMSIGDYRMLENRHRTHQPATPEQVRKWNAPPTSMSSSKYGSRSVSAVIAESEKKIKVLSNFGKRMEKLERFLFFIQHKLPHILFPGHTWMVPKIYIFRSPADLYFPEVSASTFDFFNFFDFCSFFSFFFVHKFFSYE